MKAAQLKDKYIFIFIASLEWIYLLLRCIFIPILHDEAATFYHYVQNADFIPYLSKWDANNHILNSALTWVCFRMWGVNEFVLRLPNLFSALLFFLFLFKIAMEIKRRYLRWFFIITLMGAHYFMEFFSISRGYGLSMALMFGALWYIILFLKYGKVRYCLLSLIFMFLAVSANLSLINTYILVTGVIVIYYFINFKDLDNRKRRLIPVTLVVAGMLPVLFFIQCLFVLKDSGALYYGTTKGFFEVTLKSLISVFTGRYCTSVSIYIIVVAGMIAIYYVAGFLKMKKMLFFVDKRYLFHLLFLGNIFATILICNVFRTNYPEDRVALYFFPLFIGSIFFSLDHFRKKYLPALLFLPLLFFPVHFALNANLSHNSFFLNDRIPFSFYLAMKKYHKPGDAQPILAGSYNRKLCWPFLNYKHGMISGAIQDLDYPNPDADFQIGRPGDAKFWSRYYDIIERDDVSGKNLYKRRVFLKRHLIGSFEGFHTPGMIRDEFFSLGQGSLDTLRNKSLYFSFELKLSHPKKALAAWVVLDIRDKDGKTLKYYYIALAWLQYDWNNKVFNNGILTHDIPGEADNFIAYIWNIKKTSYTLKDGRLHIFKLDVDY